jgi:hypothetical protein
LEKEKLIQQQRKEMDKHTVETLNDQLALSRQKKLQEEELQKDEARKLVNKGKRVY